MDFMKLEGCGNALLVVFVDDSKETPHWDQCSKRWCDPHFGVGADGVMVVRKGKEVDFAVDMYNPDGSRAGMCGNGIRCVVRYLILTQRLRKSASMVTFGVGEWARKVICEIRDEGNTARVDMGEPEFLAARIPVRCEYETCINQPIDDPECIRLGLRGSAVAMGNPHYVIFTNDVGSLDWREVGARLERHPCFPQRSNIEFAQVIDRSRVLLRVWERGAGATMACGSGACAVMAVGILQGLLDSPCRIELPGGNLLLEWDGSGNSIFLTGPAREICSGRLL